MSKQKTIEIEAVNNEEVSLESVNNFKPITKPTFEIIYNNTLETLKQKISVIEVKPSTLHLILKYIMEEVEETPTKGSEQKEMALKLMRALIIDLTHNEDEKVLLALLEDGTISNLIDLIVDATKGKLNINAATKVGSGCINNCIPYLFSKKK